MKYLLCSDEDSWCLFLTFESLMARLKTLIDDKTVLSRTEDYVQHSDVGDSLDLGEHLVVTIGDEPDTL